MTQYTSIMVRSASALALSLAISTSAWADCIASGSNLTCGNTVTTDTTFGTNVPNDRYYPLNSAGNITVDINAGSVVSGNGLAIGNSGTGAIAVNNNGNITAGSTLGWLSPSGNGALNVVGGAGAIAISGAGSVDGFITGISVQSAGKIDILTTGEVTGLVGSGIGAVTTGASAITISGTGPVSGGLTPAIGAVSQGGDVTVAPASTVYSAAFKAISASTIGSGKVSVTTSGAVTGLASVGIATSAENGSTTITANGTVSGSSGSSGTAIEATSTGTGAITINVAATGRLSGTAGVKLTTNNGILTVNNAGTIEGFGGMFGGPMLNMTASGTGRAIVTNSGTITGAAFFTNNADTFTNSGRLNSFVSMGGGDDTFVLRGGSVNTVVQGDLGNDTLVLNLSGSDAMPYQLDMNLFRGFERLRHEAGTVVVNSIAAFNNFNNIDVVGGRLIGNPGSNIFSNTITIAPGATFGSAGRVTGNIINNGTLSPGASPGTMTVIGNVTFNPGSNAVFELTPTLSDQLIINGALTLAGNNTLIITDTRPQVPGTVLNLFSTTSGVTGSFATVQFTGPSGGAIRQQAGNVQIITLLPSTATLGPAAGETATYINGLLTSNQASAALLSAIPSLLNTSGSVNATALAQLRPEAYASAAQIGLENGLSIATALRGRTTAARSTTARLYGFAEMFGNWRRLAGDAARGTSRANLYQSGILGGLGYGSNRASLSLFAGYVQASQNNSFLGTRTKAEGVIAGISGNAALGHLRLNGSIIRDGTGANIKRALPGGVLLADSSFALHGWTADVSATRPIALGRNWSIEPALGYTHVWSGRGAAQETGGGAFGLSVDSRQTKASFIDGSITLRGGMAEGARYRPWITLGLRHQSSGIDSLADASLPGTTAKLSSFGVMRQKTLANLGAGVEADVSSMATLFATWRSEFGSSGQNHARIGLRLGF